MNKFVKKINNLNYQKKIVLIGFMGSGKTTLGKKLASKLNISFVDLDEAIAEQEKMSISQLFETKGEDYFRKIEHQKLKEILSKNNKIVLSTGGGTPCFYENMQLINHYGISFYLKYTPAFLHSRLINAKAKRPLIQQLTSEELLGFIEQKLVERQPFYEQSNYILEEINLTPDFIIAQHLSNK